MTDTLSLNDTDTPKADTPEGAIGDSSTSEKKPFVVKRQVSRNKEFAERRIGAQRDKAKAEASDLGNENAGMAVEMARLQAENQQLQSKASQSQGMPTMAQFDNDPEQYQVALSQYYQVQNNAAIDQRFNEFNANQAESNQNAQTDSSINAHYDRAQKSGRNDYNEAETNAVNVIGSDLARGIMQYTSNSDEVIYMLGNDVEKATALANMNPTQATIEIGRLSAQAGSFNKEARPDPEDGVDGGKPPNTSHANLQKKHDALIAKAQNGGNLEELTKVRKQMREAGLI
jgi:hypothetical protein